MKKLVRWIAAYRWPAFLGGILMMSLVAQAVLVYVATRPNAPRPIENYYQRSLDWDADAAVLDASRALGWTVAIEVPAGTQYAVTARRPVDITIHDQGGEPVAGLAGRLLCQPPAQSAKLESALTELPHESGHYRTLAPLTRPGEWLLTIEASRAGTPFVHRERVNVDVPVDAGGLP